MPVVVETNFHQPSRASLMTAPSTTVVAAETPQVASIALMEVAGGPAAFSSTRLGSREAGFVLADHGAASSPLSLPFVDDSTFIDGTVEGRNRNHPPAAEKAKPANRVAIASWNGTMIPEQSRSPSLGDTFVSVSFSGSNYDSDTGPEDEERDDERAAGPRYITTASITLSDSRNNSLAAKAVLIEGLRLNQQGSRSAATNNSEDIRTDSAPHVNPTPRPFTQPEMPPLGQAPSRSGSISVSLSIGSEDEDSTVRELNEPHVSVKVIPEKKGLFLKHSEYEIKLKGTEKPVRRRYKDFVTLHGYLAEKYPYRMLPTLPPKQLMFDYLLEERRIGLQIWLTIVSLHPVLGSSPIGATFLRDTTTDYRYRMRVAYEKQMDEYSRLRPDVSLPVEAIDPLARAQTRLRNVHFCISRLLEILDEERVGSLRQLPGRQEEVDSILQNEAMREAFGEEAFVDMSEGVRLDTKECDRYVEIQQRAVMERLHVLQEVLHAHSILCERIEKGLYAEHQRVLARVANAVGSHGGTAKPKSSGSNPRGSRMHPESLLSVPEGAVIARRLAFALSCAGNETELAERYLQSLPSILLSYAHEKQRHHQQLSKIWKLLVENESNRLN